MTVSFHPETPHGETLSDLEPTAPIHHDSVTNYSQDFFQRKKDFEDVLNDSRKWKNIDDLNVTFNPNFMFGVGTCTYQDSGSFHCPNSQWATWEKQCLPEENRSGKSANLFDLYQTEKGRAALIERLQKLGVNSYRFSVEWSHIQPQKDQWNDLKLQVYVELCKDLKDAGIEPMITLHHFSEPEWFHLLGSFEKEENITHFVNFSEKVFKTLTQDYKGSALTSLFCTINEPAVEALSRYIIAAYSPGYWARFDKAAYFLKNMLKAHCLTYDTLKKIDPSAQIGITHQRLILRGTNRIFDWALSFINHLVNDTVLKCFETGDFDYALFPLHIHEKMNPKTDFVGLQYYAVVLIGWRGPCSNHEEMTEMPFREYPEGLYSAILEVHRSFRAPIIITENGISTHDETQRSRYLERALYATYLAQQTIGVPNVRGYFLWSFCDNLEWNRGMEPQAFGAYKRKKDGTLADSPKAGTAPFIKAALVHSQNSSDAPSNKEAFRSGTTGQCEQKDHRETKRSDPNAKP
ncbi:MAG: family 1 glycosylhydrolase [Chlamydiota bacterium]